MAERNCALQSAEYLKLKESYKNRNDAVRKQLTGGKQAVWMMGDDVPEEIIIAGGLVPVRLSGYYGPRLNADKYLELSFGSVWRGLFESVLNDENSDIMDYLVLSNSSDIIQKLYYYLIQLKKIEPERRLPSIEYVDYWLVDKDFRSQERNWKETLKFKKSIESWTGRKISDTDLREAILLCNEYKKMLRLISSFRYGKNCRMSGSEALTIIAGSFYMDKKEAIETISALIDEAESWPKVDNIRCLYTGSLQETTEVYTLLEDAGLNVVTEDKIFGDRYSDLDADISITPTRAVTSRYHMRFPSSERSYVEGRATVLPQKAVEVGAEAVVVFMNKNDESYIWDLPRQKIEFDKLGIKYLTVENQGCPIRDREGLSETIRNFADDVKKGNNSG